MPFFFCLWVYFDIPACMPPYVRATSHTFYIKVIQYCVSKWSRKKIMHQWPGHLGLIPIELYTAIGTFRHVLGSYPTKKRFFLMTRPGGTFLRLLISYQFHVTAYNIILCKTSWKRGLRTSDEGTFFFLFLFSWSWCQTFYSCLRSRKPARIWIQ